MGRSRSLLVGLLAVGAAYVIGVPAPAPAAEGPQVLMVDNEPDLTRWHFAPAELTVPAGTTVVWLNKGREEHSVKADDGSFDSGLKGTRGTFSRAFTKPGKYSYHCAPHPWMKGTVEVTAAAAPAARTAAADDPNAAPTATTTAPAATPPVSASAAPATPEATTPAPSAPESATTAPPAPDGESSAESDAAEGSEDEAAAPRSGGSSGDPLAGTLAIVLLPTLGALALGAKLRQTRS